MPIRKPITPFVFAVAIALAINSPFLSRADSDATGAPAASTNATPTVPPAPAPAAPVATPVAPDTNAASASAERPSTYTMESGDTLDSVAKKFDTSIHALAKLNKIPHSMFRKLRAGKVLQIPPAAK
jgi:LysM repeat protein